MLSLQGHKHEETHEGFNDLKTAAVSRDAGEDDHEQEIPLKQQRLWILVGRVLKLLHLLMNQK